MKTKLEIQELLRDMKKELAILKTFDQKRKDLLTGTIEGLEWVLS